MTEISPWVKLALMGFNITWCAVHEKDAEDFFRDMGLSPASRTDEVPDFLISSAQLDTGWRLLWYSEFTCPLLRPKKIAALSKKRDILFCQVVEGATSSSSEFWSGGRRKWWISHMGDHGPRGPRSLEIDGVLPECFPAIRREMEQVQEDADGFDYIFEIPLRVAESLVGFKHDMRPKHVVGDKFTEMVEDVPKAGFFQRLLGSR